MNKIPESRQPSEQPVYNRVGRINLGTLGQVMTEITTAVMSPITRADGRRGFMVVRAEGAITSRRKKIISMIPIFPNEEEQARLNAGETIDEIIGGYLTNKP